jgi:hypothetical protein
MKYQRVTSELICKVLEQHGGMGRIGLAESRSYMQFRAKHVVEPAQNIVYAYKLAAERIRELEKKNSELVKWQEGLSEFIERNRPTDRDAEYVGGWQLLFEEARRRYANVWEVVLDAILQRKQRELEDE